MGEPAAGWGHPGLGTGKGRKGAKRAGAAAGDGGHGANAPEEKARRRRARWKEVARNAELVAGPALLEALLQSGDPTVNGGWCEFLRG